MRFVGNCRLLVRLVAPSDVHRICICEVKLASSSHQRRLMVIKAERHEVQTGTVIFSVAVVVLHASEGSFRIIGELEDEPPVNRCSMPSDAVLRGGQREQT